MALGRLVAALLVLSASLAVPTALADGPIICAGAISVNCGPGTGCDNNPAACVVETVRDFVHEVKVCELGWQECILGSLRDCIGLDLCA